MAFSFDDFSKFFDPVSDALGTSGRKGMGLLQQKPEDLQRAAMLAALAASGYGMLTAAAPGAASVAAAGTSPTLVTAAPGILAAAPAAEVAAVVPGITAATTDLAAEEAANLAAKEAVRNSIVNSNQLTPDVLASLEPNASGIQQLAGPPSAPVEELAAQNAAKASVNQAPPAGLERQIDLVNKGPGYTDYINAQNRNVGINTFQDYQLDQARQAAAEGAKSSAIDMSLAKPTVPVYESLDTSLMPNSSIDTSQSLRSMGENTPYKIGSGDYLGEGTGEAMKNPLLKGAETAIKLVSDYPKTSAALAYITAARAGLLDQAGAEAPKDNYKNPYNMSGFRRTSPNPSAYQYKPRYAEGGIASVHDYARGKRVSSNPVTDFTDFYDQMNARPQAESVRHGDPGIYYDMDPDTRYLDPMEAAMVRMSKLNSRTNVQAPTMAPARHLGELDFKPVAAAAQGGIMGYNLGGYASGGNPRLLRGPGDGMSDHIPATINNRQPARLADGEYVITADVVSHLGNGSTEAGARQLDAMMKRIRKGRTGTSKQGKQINPSKYLPA